jgi:cytochrome P450
MEAFWLVLRFLVRLILLALVAALGFLLIRHYANAKKFKNWPGPRCTPILGNIREILSSGGIKWIREMSKKHKKVFVAWTFTEPMVFVCDAAVIRFLLTDERIIKGYSYTSTMKDALGYSILTSETDDFWRSHRRILNSFFNYNLLCSYMPRFSEQAQFMLKEYESKTGPQDMQHFALKLALIIFGDFAFHWDYSKDPFTDELLRIVDEGNVLIARVIQSGVPVWASPEWLRFRGCVVSLRKHIDEKMQLRFKQLEAQNKLNQESKTPLSLNAGNTEEQEDEELTDAVTNDVASVLLRANLEKEQMIDEVLTLLSAGHETTAQFIAFVIYSLGLYQDVQTKLKEEIDAALGDRKIVTRDDLQNLKYLQAVNNETMRYWNIVGNIPREAAADIDLSSVGYDMVIPKGSTVVGQFSVIHRDEDYYGPNATSFVPERWLNMKKDENKAFFPFGYGKRICIGQTMALLEGAVVVALVCQRFHIAVPEGHKPNLWMAVTTKSKSGLPVIFTPWEKKKPVNSL